MGQSHLEPADVTKDKRLSDRLYRTVTVVAGMAA